MNITAIKQQERLKGRYSIYADEKYVFSLSEGALLDEKLYIGMELSREQVKDYKKLSADDKAYGLTLAYVARRPRSEWELRDYLRRKGYDEVVSEQIMERLRTLGFVNDESFARSWVDNRRLLKPVSKRRLQQELRQKRVSDEVISKVLQEDETDEQDTLRQLITRKRKQTRYQDNQKLMQYLARQGFNYDDIKSAMADTEPWGSEA